MTMAQRRRSSNIRIQAGRQRTMATRIQRAYRRRRYGRYVRPRTRFIAGAGTLTAKARVNRQIKFGDMRAFQTLNTVGAPNDSRVAYIYFAPWRNVSTEFDTNAQSNLFYSDTLQKYFSEPTPYGCFKLSGVYMQIRRTKQLLESREVSPTTKDNSFYDRTSHLWGTEILHTQQVLNADATTGVVQPAITTISQGRTVRQPTSWDEAVDDGAGRFKVSMGAYQKRVWKPANMIERRWRQVENSELDHSTGGIMLILKNGGYAVPNYAEYTTLADQVIFELVATIYMSFKVLV